MIQKNAAMWLHWHHVGKRENIEIFHYGFPLLREEQKRLDDQVK